MTNLRVLNTMVRSRSVGNGCFMEELIIFYSRRLAHSGVCLHNKEILSITLLTALFFHEHAHKNRRFHTKFHPHDNHPIVLVVAISNLNDTLSPANKTSNYPVDGLDSVQIQ